jgi:phage baseplate assembly protein W
MAAVSPHAVIGASREKRVGNGRVTRCDQDSLQSPPEAIMSVDAWTGHGPEFPFRPGPGGRLAYVGGDALIRQSIEAILDTEPGERVMLPTFGCGLRRYLMRPNTPATRTSMRQEITDSLARWEPRVQVTEVAVTPGDDPALVWISIRYTALADRRDGNLVYPFYLR